MQSPFQPPVHLPHGTTTTFQKSTTAKPAYAPITGTTEISILRISTLTPVSQSLKAWKSASRILAISSSPTTMTEPVATMASKTLLSASSTLSTLTYTPSSMPTSLQVQTKSRITNSASRLAFSGTCPSPNNSASAMNSH